MTTTTTSPTTVAGIDCLTVKIAGDRAVAFATYAKVKDAVRQEWDRVSSLSGDAGIRARENYTVAFKYPCMLLWNRMVPVHQGNSGHAGGNNDHFQAWVKGLAS